MLLALSSGCTDLVREVVAKKVIEKMERIEHYQATTRVFGQQNREIKLYYEKFWHIHQEVVAPAAARGELFLFDGERFVFYRPRRKIAFRITGIHEPSLEEWRRMVTQRITHASETAKFEREGREAVLGRETVIYRSSPKGNDPVLPFVSRTWIDAETQVPLKAVNYLPDGSVLQGFEHTRSDFDSPLPPDAFRPVFAPGTEVIEWNLGAITAGDHAADLLVQPASLPDGLSLEGAGPSAGDPRVWLSHYANRPLFMLVGQWSADHWPFPFTGGCEVRVLGRDYRLLYLSGLNLAYFTHQGRRVFVLSNLTLDHLLTIPWRVGRPESKPIRPAVSG